jgi:tetratricopeptide (TPR) repeat protein
MNGMALAGGALAVLVGALMVYSWASWRGTTPAAPSLPDPPSPQEKALAARMAAARSDDPGPARLLGDYSVDAALPFAALWAYARALQARPADVPATLGLARGLEQAGFSDEAITRLRQVLRSDPGQSQAAAQLAELYLQTGQPEAALGVVRGAGMAFAGSKDGAVLEGRVRQALGDAAGAKAAYWRAVARDANDAAVRHWIGRLALSQGEQFQAQQAFGAARIMDSTSAAYQVDLGRAYAASSRPEEQRRALELYAAAISQSPRYGPAHYEAGVWYLRQSRWKEAVERLQMAVACEPRHADAHEALARALEAVGRRAEAHQHRGLAFEARGLPIAALREYQAWAALAPDNPEAEIQVAQSYFDVNRAKEAQARLEKARGRFLGSAELRERLIAFSILGLDQARARRLCEEWLREEPDSPQALWLLGRTAAAEQRHAESIRLYEQALAREPDNSQWMGTLGETLLTLPGAESRPEENRRALASLARAAAGAPHEPRWRLLLAQGLQRQGRVEDARRQALRALDLDPRQGRAYSLVVQCARQEKAAGPLSLFAELLRAAEARQREEQSLRLATWERPRDPAACAALAAFLLRTGNPVAAEDQLAEALRLRPQRPELRARLAMLRRLREVL